MTERRRRRSDEQLKAIIKEANAENAREWLDNAVKEVGIWSMRGIAILLAYLCYHFVLSRHAADVTQVLKSLDPIQIDPK